MFSHGFAIWALFHRLYNVQTGKLKRSYKGSAGDDGSLHTMTIDSTGTLLAVSSSDKSIAIIDFYSGEIVATLVGHSENITGLRFTNDCTHLISTSADGWVSHEFPSMSAGFSVSKSSPRLGYQTFVMSPY